MTTEQPAVAAPPTFDRAAAHQQCQFLGRGDPGERFVFQTFADRKVDKGNMALTATRHGTFNQCADWLAEMNGKKAGIFVTVNRTRGAGRTDPDIVGVRACFFDHDEKNGPMRAASPLPGSLVITSGHGSHCYYLLDTDADPAVFTTLQTAIANHLGTDPSVTDLPRVMRLAGSINWKEEPVQVTLVEMRPERTYTVEQVARAFGVDPTTLAATPRKNRAVPAPAGEPTADHQRIRTLCPWFDRQFTHSQEIREPEWFGGLSIVARCINAEDVAQEMSSGHPDYTLEETAEKLDRAARYVAPWCSSVAEKFNFAGCAGCPNHRRDGGPLDHGKPAADAGGNADGAEAAPDAPEAENSASDIAEAAVVALEKGQPEKFLCKATFTALAKLDSDARDLLVLRIRTAIRLGRRTLGVTQKDVNSRLEAAIRAQNRQARRQRGSGLPVIQINDAQLRDTTDAAMEALAAANDREPKDFVRCGKLVRITVNEEDHLPSASEHSVATFKGRLSRVADFEYDAGNRGILACAPSNELVEEILGRADFPEMPYLAGLTTAPIARPDGSFHTTPGFDPDTGLFLAQIGDPVTFNIPEHPSPDDVANAVQALRFVFADFPLVGEASFAHILALLLTMLLRPLFKGCVPLFLVRASSVGTGKSLVVEVCGIIVYGCEHLSVFAPGNSDEEMRKRITSALMEARPVIAIDNIEGRLSSDALAALITTGSWSDRKLGGNSTVRIRNRTTVTATGNNLQVDDDLWRRLKLIDLCYEGEHPEQRTGFQIPHLKAWAFESRDQLLGSLMVLIRNWHVQGKPKPEHARPFGSFEAWQEMVGGIIEAAGVTGFGNDAQQMETLNDGLTVQWGPFLRAVHHLTWGQPFPISDIAEKCPDARAGANGDPLLADTLPSSLAARSDRGHGNLNHALGQGFKRIKGVNCKGFILEHAGNDPKSNVNLWRVRASNQEDVAEPSRSGIRFLDLLHAAGRWQDALQHRREADGQTLCKRTVGDAATPSAHLARLPTIPAPDSPGFEPAVRAWAQHFVDAVSSSAAVVQEAEVKAMVGRVCAAAATSTPHA